ncbi:NYN domain-containing protein [Noviherbaspirillum sp. L7-7A]|uniref:NYN domain-containing protein n=1 Tax=Noviherbaspirillum sp. L7-7A TaxID=2850560 RepID=UPI001C2C7F45|nr:NYN domain-containing protein [Noviherbaspirillum sp. L7-7A]MBV0881745.1 NYN domain-containing protein [Noviherbaspirillum sp. L7-7A]
MAAPNDNISMALYCDFENVALGVRDAKYDKFNIRPVLERLLLKGSIVVKKAYCDWDRYKEFKPQMHEASFELIEIPHVRMSGKNSADIRLVVDALDLCYTKSHVNTFVIISGDSDFSPLVSKLRENAKYVIGVGVKDSTSDLLVANCDEFIFIDDLVRESRRAAASRETRQSPAAGRRPAPVEDEHKPKESLEVRKNRAVDLASETFEALMAERGDNGKIWASALKQAIKRRKPDFNEVYFGFRTFGNLLEELQSRGMLEIGRDDKSGSYVYRSSRALAEAANLIPVAAVEATSAEKPEAPGRGRRNDRDQRPRSQREEPAEAAAPAPAWYEPGAQLEPQAAQLPDDQSPEGTQHDTATETAEAQSAFAAPDEAGREQGRRRGARKSARGRQGAGQADSTDAMPAAAAEPETIPEPAAVADAIDSPALPATPEPALASGIDLPVSNAQRRAMRNSRMPARARKAGEVKPAAPEAVLAAANSALPGAPADVADAAGNDGSNGQRRGGRRTKSGAQAKPDTAIDAMPRLDTPQVQEESSAAGDAQQPTPAKKRSSRSTRARKPKADAAAE